MNINLIGSTVSVDGFTLPLRLVTDVLNRHLSVGWGESEAMDIDDGSPIVAEIRAKPEVAAYVKAAAMRTQPSHTFDLGSGPQIIGQDEIALIEILASVGDVQAVIGGVFVECSKAEAKALLKDMKASLAAHHAAIAERHKQLAAAKTMADVASATKR